jgi:hypothetical protein
MSKINEVNDSKVTALEVTTPLGVNLSSENSRINHSGSGTLTLETGHKLFVTAGTEGIFIGSGSSAIPINIGTTGSTIKIKGSNYNTGGGGGAGNTDELEEGSVNWYFSDAHFATRLATKTTDNLTQGSANQYFTDAKAVAAVTGALLATTIDSDDVTQGSVNLYFTDAKAVAAVTGALLASTIDSDDVTQGSVNLYFTDAKAVAAVTGALLATTIDSDDVTQGSVNLYFTDAKAVAAVTGALLAETIKSDDVKQGSVNLYFTDAKAIAAIVDNNGITSNNLLTFGSLENKLTLESGSTEINAIKLDVTSITGGIHLNSGEHGVRIDSVGNIHLVSQTNVIVGTGAEGGLDLIGGVVTVSSVDGEVRLQSGSTAIDAIKLDVTSITGGIDVNSGLGGINISSSGDIIIENTSNALDPHSIYLHATENNSTTAIYIQSDAGGVSIDAIRNILLHSQTANIELHSDAADLTALYIHTSENSGDIVIESDRHLIIDANSSDAGQFKLNAGSGGVLIDTTGRMELFSHADGLTALHIQSIAGDGTSGDIVIESAKDTYLQTAGAITIDAGAASNFTTTAGDLTLSATQTSVSNVNVTAAVSINLTGGVIGAIQPITTTGDAISLATLTTTFTASDDIAVTLPNGTNGQLKNLYTISVANTKAVTITGTVKKATTTYASITLNAASGQTISLIYLTGAGWVVLSDVGAPSYNA